MTSEIHQLDQLFECRIRRHLAAPARWLVDQKVWRSARIFQGYDIWVFKANSVKAINEKTKARKIKEQNEQRINIPRPPLNINENKVTDIDLLLNWKEACETYLRRLLDDYSSDKSIKSIAITNNVSKEENEHEIA